MKIALVHDDLIQHGGAERLFQALVEMFPGADVYTSMAIYQLDSLSAGQQVGKKKAEGKSKAAQLSGCLADQLNTSFMQKLPFKKKLYRVYFPFYPFAFESFDLTDYDLVISSSARFAHGVIAKPGTVHICYMNSPGRMWWETGSYFGSGSGQRKPLQEKPVPIYRDGLGNAAVLSPFLSWLRQWDYTAAQRVDYFIANSCSVQKRIKRFYGRESTVIHPFVNLGRFNLRIDSNKERIDSNIGINSFFNSNRLENFFLIVSRLARWKRIDIAVKACNKLKQPLVIVGEGPDRKRLEKMAGPTIEFLGRLSDADVVRCYQACRALLFPQREDFGIAPLEAMACGKPVIAYRAGGAEETILPGETGEFFYPQTVRALSDAISGFDARRYRADVCRGQAAKFSRRRFEKRIRGFIESCCGEDAAAQRLYG